MMTIEVKVNGQLIKDIVIHNIGSLDEDKWGNCIYEVTYKDEKQQQTFHIEHYRADGGLSLIRKVIIELQHRLNV